MTPTELKPAAVAPRTIDMSRLLAMANTAFGFAVDWGMNGGEITNCDVVMHGAYGPALKRLINRAVNVHAEPHVVDKLELRALADVAYAEATDIDFGGNVMTDYGILHNDEYGFGLQVLGMVNLAIEHQAILRGAAPTAA